MVCSMTGFGKASGQLKGDEISVELSTVNHRFLDCTLRLPSSWTALEQPLKGVVKDTLGRGKVYAVVTRKRGAEGGGQAVQFDAEIARSYVDASKELVRIQGTMETLSIDTLIRLDGVVSLSEPEEDLDSVLEFLTKLLGEALAQADQMRQTEGGQLAADIRGRVAGLREILARIEERLPEVRKLYEERLRQRIADLVDDPAVTEERVMLEVAVMAEKSDVTEEVVRLKGHYDHIEELLEAAEPIGRRLDFLAQEIQREMNTLGVKCRDSAISREVLDMKAELEKVREQLQNIE
jgi:uncharacterized protein (TIGR00255 family)